MKIIVFHRNFGNFEGDKISFKIRWQRSNYDKSFLVDKKR